MNIDTYHDEWSKDGPLRLDNLDEDARNVPFLHAKWWKYYSTERLRYKKLSFEYKTLYRQRWQWYAGKMTDDERTSLGWDPQPLKILSTDMSTYLDGDPLIQTAQARLALAEETCRFLEDVIKSINNRNYTIKNTIDYLRFKMGS